MEWDKVVDGKFSTLFKGVWHWDGPDRIKFHLWKICQEILPTNALRVHQHMAMDDKCPVCNLHPESLHHALRDCKWVNKIWLAFNVLPNSLLFQQDVGNWVATNLVKTQSA